MVEGGALSDGGNLLAWLERTLRRRAASSSCEPDGHGLMFLALLGGERSPGWNPRATGAIAGLTFDDRRAATCCRLALEGDRLPHAPRSPSELPEVQEVVGTGQALLATSRLDRRSSRTCSGGR